MDNKKNDKSYYSIGELAKMFKVKASLIRYWEKEFTILKPFKNRNGNRMFTKKDIENFHLIYNLVKEKRMTLEGAKKALKDNKEGVENNFKIVKNLEKIKSLLTELKEDL